MTFDFDAWSAGEEGTRVVEAAAKALHDAQFFIAGDGQPAIRVLPDEQAATVALRAALSLTTTCARCNETGFIKEPDWDSPNVSAVGVPMKPCPDCKGGTVPGESVLVVREQLEQVGWFDSRAQKNYSGARRVWEYVNGDESEPTDEPVYRLLPLEKEDET